ncbi:MAG: EamA family transporter [Clostridia bacterium]|nr:EamA family transporter [Clostridia bacterium]
MKKKLPSLLILAAAFLWGLTGIFVRTLNSAGLDNLQLLFFRSAITCGTLFVFLFFTDREKLKIDLKDIWYFIGTGVLSFWLFGICYFYTISHASMSLAAMLLYTAPFFVMIMSAIFFREKITAAKILALMTAAIGCVMICGTDKNTNISPFIIFTGLASGFCYALYSIFGRVALKKYSSATVTVYTFLFAAVASMFLTDFSVIKEVAFAEPSAILLAILFAFISAFFPYIFYTLGLKNTEPGKAAVMATFEAVVASVAGILVFNETMTVVALAGIALVLFSVFLLNRK